MRTSERITAYVLYKSPESGWSVNTFTSVARKTTTKIMQVYTGTRLTTAIHGRASLRTADVFPVVASLAPKNIF